VLRRGVPAGRYWYAVPALVLAILGVWCLARVIESPWELAFPLSGKDGKQPASLARAIAVARHNFRFYHQFGAALCLAGMAAWAACWYGLPAGRWLVPVAGGAWLLELLIFAAGVNPQCDPALYYPRLPALEELARRPPGRVLGFRCLTPLLNEVYGLQEVRGYDAVDPLWLVELLNTVKDRRFVSPVYAETSGYVPLMSLGPDGKGRLPPVLNMLNVRYIIGRGRHPAPMQPIIDQEGYWVWENEEVLPRTYVPATVRPAPAGRELLRLLGADSFNPRQVAYLDNPPSLPALCKGSAEIIVEESSNHLSIQLDMETRGLVVLSDLWYPGWEATLDGQPLPILRVNHALRGVVVPAGQGKLDFNYRPSGFTVGVRLCLSGLVGLLLWATGRWLIRRRGVSRVGVLSPTSAASPKRPKKAPAKRR
jgi:hypothetical protein